MKYIGKDRPNSFTNGSVYNISKHSAGYVKTKDDSGSPHSLDIYFVLQNFIHPSHYKPEPEQKLESIYQVGDTVYHWQHGEGNIYQISHERNKLFPIFVKFDSVVYQFATDGKQNVNDKEPSLSFTPYGLKNGGLSQKRPKPEPKNGDWGWFWGNKKFEDVESARFGEFAGYHPDGSPQCKSIGFFASFSIEMPPRMKSHLCAIDSK